MGRSVLIVLTSAVVGFLASVQVAGSQAVIHGRVMDASTGTGIPDAVVTASLQGSLSYVTDVVRTALPTANADPSAVTRTIRTGSDGGFSAEAMAEGLWFFTARSAGYVPGGNGQNFSGVPIAPITVSSAKSTETPIIRLVPTASISGEVSDSQGNHLPNLPVLAVRRITKGGDEVSSIAGRTITDAGGHYRIPDLVPGAYVVVVPSVTVTYPAAYIQRYRADATSPSERSLMTRELLEVGGQPSPTALRQGNNLIQSSGMYLSQTLRDPDPNVYRVFVPATYPDAAEAGSIVELGPGQKFDAANLKLATATSLAVRGVAVGPDGPLPGLPLHLSRIEPLFKGLGADGDAGRSITDANGRFDFQGIPAGDYTIRLVRPPDTSGTNAPPYRLVNIEDGSAIASPRTGRETASPASPPENQPTWWTETAVHVGRETPEQRVAILRGKRVSGRVSFVGGSAPPDAAVIAGLTVGLRPVGELTSLRYARVRTDRTFSTFEVPNGRYSVVVPVPDPRWTLVAINIGGRNYVDGTMDVSSDLTGAELVFSDVTTVVTGQTRDGNQRASDGLVVLFPADLTAWVRNGMSERKVRYQLSRGGAFTFDHLLPGEYLLAALDPSVRLDPRDPKNLAELARVAKHISIGTGDHKIETLVLSRITREP